MNSEAERARNARKRAKLRAKKRGDGPSLRRVSVTIHVWATDPEAVYLNMADKGCYSSCSRVEPGCCDNCEDKDYGNSFRTKEFISGERLLTRHEVTIQDLTWLEVFCVAVNEELRTLSTPSHPAHAHIRIEILQNGQRRDEEWQVEVGEVEVADLAAEF